MLNMNTAAFHTRMNLYLKPKNGSLSLMLILLMVDTILSITYITAQFAYVLEGNYEDEQDKLV